jgi:hypothetical protein
MVPVVNRTDGYGAAPGLEAGEADRAASPFPVRESDQFLNPRVN